MCDKEKIKWHALRFTCLKYNHNLCTATNPRLTLSRLRNKSRDLLPLCNLER